MFKFSPLLLIGIVLALWGRGMTFEDCVMIGLGEKGHLELKSGAAAVSVNAAPGMHQLGRWFSFEHRARAVAPDASAHRGNHLSFRGPFEWSMRLSLLTLVGVLAVLVFVWLKIFRAQSA